MLSSVKIPRCYYLPDETIVMNQIHGFSDASERAYAAVVYLRSVYRSGNISVSLVASKTRVAPLKKQTIPRLELLGANDRGTLIEQSSNYSNRAIKATACSHHICPIVSYST